MPELLERTLSPAQAARQLGLSVERIRQMTKSGTLQSIETPLGHLIPTDAVDRLAEQRRVQREGAHHG